MKAGPSHPAAATALECAGAHLASWALRCIEPHVLPMAPALELLERLWRSGRYPPLLWVHDLLALVAGGEVGLPPGLDDGRGVGFGNDRWAIDAIAGLRVVPPVQRRRMPRVVEKRLHGGRRLQGPGTRRPP